MNVIVSLLLRPFKLGWALWLIIGAFALAGFGLKRIQEAKPKRLAVPVEQEELRDSTFNKPAAAAKAVLFQSPTPALQAWQRGREMALAGKPGDAIPYLEKAIALAKAEASKDAPLYEFYRDLGAAYVLTNQGELAVEPLKKALDLKPNSVEILNLRANAYAQQEKWRRAMRDLEQYLKQRPNSDTAWVNLGAVAEKRGQYQNAMEAYEKALALKPQNEQAQLGKATLQARMGLYQAALPMLEKLAQLHPNEVPYQMNRALALYHTESLTAAVDGFTKVLKLDNGNAEALTLRGVAHYRLGNQYGACRDWTKAASLGDSDASKALKKYCKNGVGGRVV